MRIPFQRLAADSDPGVRRAVGRVLASGRFVLGPEVEAFERAFAASIGVAHAVGVASGTDAITLALAAAGIGPGDRVLTAAFSTGYTAIGIRHAGATPVFADVEPESLCLDAGAVARALEEQEVRAIVPVHIFGGAGAGWGKLLEIADRHRDSRHRGRLSGARSARFGAGARLLRAGRRVQLLSHQEPRGPRRRRAGGHGGRRARGARAEPPFRRAGEAPPPPRAGMEQPPRRNPGRGASGAAPRAAGRKPAARRPGASLPGVARRAAAALRDPGARSGGLVASLRDPDGAPGRAPCASRSRRHRRPRALSGRAHEQPAFSDARWPAEPVRRPRRPPGRC